MCAEGNVAVRLSCGDRTPGFYLHRENMRWWQYEWFVSGNCGSGMRLFFVKVNQENMRCWKYFGNSGYCGNRDNRMAVRFSFVRDPNTCFLFTPRKSNILPKVMMMAMDV